MVRGFPLPTKLKGCEKMKKLLSLSLGLSLLACLFLPGCGQSASESAPPAASSSATSASTAQGEDIDYITDIPKEGEDIEPSDYSDPANWSHITEEPLLPVDVFVLAPTGWQREEGEQILCPITHPGMRASADDFLLHKASCLEGVGNFYLPYYRQMDATYLLGLPVEEQGQYLNGASKTDCLAAFDHYIQNYNEGRPFILFSHSQGSSMMLEVLADYMAENPEVYGRMVAAYVIGYSVTEAYLSENPHLAFAEGAEDTGVIISYNTEAPNADPGSTVWLEGSVAINPISWARTGEAAPASDNLGSMMLVDGQLTRVEGLADAAVDTRRGVVLCSSVDPEEYSVDEPMRAIFPYGVYHAEDISFYYFNLRQNAENRVERFLEDWEAVAETGGQGAA